MFGTLVLPCHSDGMELGQCRVDGVGGTTLFCAGLLSVTVLGLRRHARRRFIGPDSSENLVCLGALGSAAGLGKQREGGLPKLCFAELLNRLRLLFAPTVTPQATLIRAAGLLQPARHPYN